MIDTSEYKGHTPGHWATTTRKGTWVVYTQDNGDVATMNDYEDAKLIADSPLLLEEVKRLQAWKKLVSDIVQQHDGSHLREMLKEMIE